MEDRKRSRAASALLLGLLMAGMLASALPAGAVTSGTTEGCTPGYWKTHTSQWDLPYTTTTTIIQAFPGIDPTKTPYENYTLLQALNFQGGSDVFGAQRILLRAAVAALLNAEEEIAFPWRRDAPSFGRPALLQAVANAINSGSRTQMLNLAAQLDRDNNLGCPLS